MMDESSAVRCEHLKRLFAERSPESSEEQIAQAIDEHVAACPFCSSAETTLAELIIRYRTAKQPPLPDDLLSRILDRVCR